MQKQGFTLLELLIVITILGIIALIALTRYGPVLENARASEAFSVLSEIVAAEKRYYIDDGSGVSGAYTTTITDLDSFEAVPASDNFTFSIPSANTTSGYAQAARKGSAQKSHGMCLKSGARATCAGAATCNPGCS